MRSRQILGAAVVCTFCVLNGRLSAAIINLPEITVSSFGHIYTDPTPTNQLAGISDGVSFRGGRGTFSVDPSFTGVFQNGDVVRQHIVAPAGYQFFVFKHPGLPSESFGGQFEWATDIPDPVGVTAPISLSYDNPTGSAPGPIFSTAGVSSSGKLAQFDFHGAVTGNFTFTGMTAQFTVPSSPSNVTRTFSLTSSSDPSMFAIGIGFLAVNSTILGLSPIPEPTGLLAGVLSCLGVFGRRRYPRIVA